MPKTWEVVQSLESSTAFRSIFQRNPGLCESVAGKSKNISKVSLMLPDLTKSHPVAYSSLSSETF